MRRRKSKWLPYVEDDQNGGVRPAQLEAPREKLLSTPDNFKTFDHRCCVCGGDGPFGVDYPRNPKWFCRQHVGEVMPEIPQNMERNRLKEVRRKSIRATQLWLDMLIAADNSDAEGCRQLWKQIRDVSIETSDILKAMPKEDANERA